MRGKFTATSGVSSVKEPVKQPYRIFDYSSCFKFPVREYTTYAFFVHFLVFFTKIANGFEPAMRSVPGFDDCNQCMDKGEKICDKEFMQLPLRIHAVPVLVAVTDPGLQGQLSCQEDQKASVILR